MIHMESYATQYSLVFHDGECEHDKGQIGVYPGLTFKTFQAHLSHKTGFPAHQLSTVLVCRKMGKDTGKRQKLPINDNTNFNVILSQHNPAWEKECHFSVFLKRSKKERRGTRRRSLDAENGESSSPRSDVSSFLGSQQALQDATTASTQPKVQGGLLSVVPSSQLPRTTAFPDKVILRREQRSPAVANGSKQAGSKYDGLQHSKNTLPLVHQADLPNVWGQNPVPDGILGSNHIDDGILANITNHGSIGGQTSPYQELLSQQIADGFLERYRDGAAARLRRDGFINVASSIPAPLTFSPISMGYPTAPISSGYQTTPEMLLPSGISSGLSGLAPSNAAALKLQQAQAHYLNLQSQQTEQLHLTQQALSRMRGVFQGLPFYGTDNQLHTGVCQHCYACRERNIIPTPFHLCVHDKVTNGFRGPSPAGPIERPAKRVEAAA